MALNEFKPPSDFVADDGGGGGKSSIWKWLGIGCGVIVLIIGLLLALGTWKTVSCCNTVMDQARLTVEAREFARQFGDDLAGQEIEQARGKMTEGLAAEIPADALESKVAEYHTLLSASPGRVSDVSVQKTDMEQPTVWKISVEFAPPAGNEKLVLLTEIVSRGEGESQRFLVDGLRFDKRSRDIGSEPPAVEVLDFHRQVRGGNFESAYRHMSKEFTSQTSLDAFRSFVREQQEVFRTGQVDIQSVGYSANNSARVVAVATGEGERVRVEYELVRPVEGMPKWLISGISPVYEDAAPAAAQKPEAQPPADAGAAEADAQAPGADAGDKGDEQN